MMNPAEAEKAFQKLDNSVNSQDDIDFGASLILEQLHSFARYSNLVPLSDEVENATWEQALENTDDEVDYTEIVREYRRLSGEAV